jgi:DNA-binding response OmpR family regulator
MSIQHQVPIDPARAGLRSPTLDGAPRTRRRALVADDDIDCAECLTMLLERAGFEVRVAHDGESAVALAAGFRPDIALVDVVMPLLDGREVAAHVRSSAWEPRMTLIATSGMSSEVERRAALASGFDAYLMKPLDYELLHGLLRAVSLADAPRPRS